jgi:hypothetical protein
MKLNEGKAASSIDNGFGKDLSMSNLISFSVIKKFQFSKTCSSPLPYFILLTDTEFFPVLITGTDMILRVELVLVAVLIEEKMPADPEITDCPLTVKAEILHFPL